MIKMRADWVQLTGGFKDVRVTLKVLKSDSDFPVIFILLFQIMYFNIFLSQEFMKLANTWSKIYSPQFIKLYGLTLSTPYTMIMEHSKFGQLNDFLMHLRDKVLLECLLDVVHGLVRAIVYLVSK